MKIDKNEKFAEATTGGVQQKRVHKSHGKTPVLESLFSKIAGLWSFRPAILLRKDSSTGVYL